MDFHEAGLNPDKAAAEIADILLSEYGFTAVLIKGIPQDVTFNVGGQNGNDELTNYSGIKDICHIGKECFEIYHEYVDTRNSHGTGCTLSSAIASNLARGRDLTEAVIKGTEFVHNALEKGKSFRWYAAPGHGPTLILPPDFNPQINN